MAQAPIVLLGGQANGKTCIMNNVCGSHFPSHMGARSCTRTVQLAYTRMHKVGVIDTPGFSASEDVAAHVAAQKLALEDCPLSGIYIVIKYGRADDIVAMLNVVMNFVGDDDIRVIVTHGDIARQQEGFDEGALKDRISSLLDIPTRNILVVGKDTSSRAIEEFIMATRHAPRKFRVGEEQLAMISSLSVGFRKLNKPIDQALAKIEAASKECFAITKMKKSYQTDVAVTTIQHATTTMVRQTKTEIFQLADDLLPDQQHFVYGKAGLALSLRLKDFVNSTNTCLSWNVTDLSDVRNAYKQCNYCGAIFNKTEGCDGKTICGTVPRDVARPRPNFFVQFMARETGWGIQYNLDGKKVNFQDVLSTMATEARKTLGRGGDTKHVKRKNAEIESGCGNTISWNTMLPVDPGRVAILGMVEVERPDKLEIAFKASFEDSVRRHERANRNILRQSMPP